jgi:hypothetical protein
MLERAANSTQLNQGLLHPMQLHSGDFVTGLKDLKILGAETIKVYEGWSFYKDNI